MATIVGLPSGSFSKGIKLATANLTGALSRIDSVLDAKPVSESSSSDHPADSTVDLSDVHFSYDGKTDVICGVSMEIAAGQTVAFVRPFGRWKIDARKPYHAAFGDICLKSGKLHFAPRMSLTFSKSRGYVIFILLSPQSTSLILFQTASTSDASSVREESMSFLFSRAFI